MNSFEELLKKKPTGNKEEDTACITELQSALHEVLGELKNQDEIIRLFRKKQFGSSSERTKPDETGQTNLFNEAEAETGEAPEPVRKTGRGFMRTEPKTGREKLLEHLPIEECVCELPEEEMQCPHCGSKLAKIGREIIREELEYVPAKLTVIRYIRYAYACPKCKKTTHPYIVKSAAPSPVLNHSLASASSVAYVMYRKYVNGMPLYRQEKDWEQQGIALSRTTLANWIIRCAEDWLFPIRDVLHRKLVQRDILHCDETPVQVLKEPGKKAESKSYMWLYRTGEDEKPPIVLYDYKPSRSGENAANYLTGFQGYLHTDGYSGYNKVTGITRCGCWAHLRRYFVDTIEAGTTQGAGFTNAEIGRNYCDQLFAIEKTLFGLPDEQRKEERLKLEKPLLEAFWCWLETLNPLRGSRLGKAVTYAFGQKPYMENYLLDGRCSISNNLAENSIRPFTVGRKNWLFSDTVNGAKASAAIYSLVETAKANGLNIYAYLNYLLLYMPDTDFHCHPELLEDLMPWSQRILDACKIES